MMRSANDFYPTSERLGAALFPLLGKAHGEVTGSICEPCAGTNDLADVIAWATGRQVVTNDIDPYMPSQFFGDAADPYADIWKDRYYNWTITNPPFSQATDIVRNAWNHSDNVAMLLRLSWFEPTRDRADLLTTLADHMILFAPVGSPRPQFRFGHNPTTGRKYGNDSVTVAWCAWAKYRSWDALGVASPFQFITNWKTTRKETV